MKELTTLFFILFISILVLTGCKADTEHLKIITYNIQNRSDTLRWESRQELMAEYVNKYEPDIAGLQEVTMSEHEWIKYLPDAFGKKYAYIGESRSDDPAQGLEACLIFYRKDKFKLVDSGTFWLNETGEKAVVGWDGAYPRTCTYAILKARASGKSILVMNTHLDHVGNEARIKGFDLIMKKAKELSNFEYPLFILGDLNTYETQGNGNYDHFMSYDEIADTKYLADESDEGVTFIFAKYGYPIDHIFTSNNDSVDIIKYKIMDDFDLHENYYGIDMSDHYGVYVEATLN